MKVQVVTEEMVVWVITVGQIPSRASRDGPVLAVWPHVPHVRWEDARARVGVGQRTAYR